MAIFKNKKPKEQQTQTIAVTPQMKDNYTPDPTQEIQEVKQQIQEVQQQQMQQPQQQPVQQQPQSVQPVQSVQQQVQQPAQVEQQQPYAYVKQIQVSEPGVFHIVIETNYPLAIGYCQLTQ